MTEFRNRRSVRVARPRCVVESRDCLAFVASRLALPGDRVSEVTYLPMGDRLGPLTGPCDRDLTRISRLNFFTSRKKFFCIAQTREAGCKCASSRDLVSRSLLSLRRRASRIRPMQSSHMTGRLGVFTGLSRSRLAVSSGIRNQLSLLVSSKEFLEHGRLAYLVAHSTNGIVRVVCASWNIEESFEQSLEELSTMDSSRQVIIAYLYLHNSRCSCSLFTLRTLC